MRIIPMSRDVAEAVGESAEHIDNPSLLADKFVAPKYWVDLEEKIDNAHRWSMLRLARHGRDIIAKELAEAKKKVDKADRSKQGDLAELAKNLLPGLKETAKPHPPLAKLRTEHTDSMRRLLERSPFDHAGITARLESRLAINLSDGLVENAGICLDRLFGTPCIPGTAVKGCARNAALAELKDCRENNPGQLPDLFERFLRVFGAADNDYAEKAGGLSRFGRKPEQPDRKGMVGFLPATAGEDAHLVVELSNVHTPEYYTGSKQRPAGEPEALATESPRPNPFPAVESGAVFSFNLSLNALGQRHPERSQILDDARRWLESALTVYGIGAKTGAGMGWFSLLEEPAPEAPDSGAAAVASGSAAPVNPDAVGDYTPESYRNKILEPVKNPGKRDDFFNNHFEALKAPKNRPWLKKLIEDTATGGGKAMKKTRAKEWYQELQTLAQNDG